MNEFAQLSIGGIFCVLVLREVFSFLKGRDKKTATGESNGSGPTYRSAAALENIAENMQDMRDHIVKQTTLLEAIRDDHRLQAEAIHENSRILAGVQAHLRQ